MNNPLIEFQQVCKYYHMGDTTVVAADHISFEICPLRAAIS